MSPYGVKITTTYNTQERYKKKLINARRLKEPLLNPGESIPQSDLTGIR
jgi:hypothetical protein